MWPNLNHFLNMKRLWLAGKGIVQLQRLMVMQIIASSPMERAVAQVEPLPSKALEVQAWHKEAKLIGSAVVSSFFDTCSQDVGVMLLRAASNIRCDTPGSTPELLGEAGREQQWWHLCWDCITAGSSAANLVSLFLLHLHGISTRRASSTAEAVNAGVS